MLWLMRVTSGLEFVTSSVEKTKSALGLSNTSMGSGREVWVWQPLRK